MINRPKGTKDVLPNEIAKYNYFEQTARKVFAKYNFKEIRTPVFEHTELFVRGVGESSDIVNKEMYTFKDKADRSLTLKPEGTASIARAVIENGLDNEAMPLKLFSYVPCFRYEKPQSGRLREHHQFSIEAYGSNEASLDVEVMGLVSEIFNQLNFTNYELNINSIGCAKCRKTYIEKLKEYYTPFVNNLCEDCKRRFQQNPLRLLDCKESSCTAIKENAPKPKDYLCEDCKKHFDEVKLLLEASKIPYKINPILVRGLDYYTKTVFEFMTTEEGALGTICGGGRYDGLLEELGGKPLSGVGVGLGEERILILLEKNKIDIPQEDALDLFVATTDKQKLPFVMQLVNLLRNKNFKVDYDQCGRSLKSQMKFADKIGAKNIVVIGDNEINTFTVQLKNMKTGAVKTDKINNISKLIK